MSLEKIFARSIAQTSFAPTLLGIAAMGAVLLASHLPARRAAGVNPTEALRGD